MKKLVILLALGVALTGCQTAKKQEMAATEPVAVDAKSADTKVAMTDKAAAPAMVDKNAKFPVKTKDGLWFGDQRRILSECQIPAESKLKGEPLNEAMVAAWPPQGSSDIAVFKAALAGVAYPEEVAFIQDCVGAKVLEQQVPGPLATAK